MFTTFSDRCRWIIGGCLLFSAPGLVLGQSEVESGWFVEAGFINADASGDVAGFAIDDEETGWSLSLGYAINRYLSIRAGYHDFGDRHFATDCPPPSLCLVENVEQVSIDGVSLAAIGTWPLTRMLDVYGTLGVMSWNTDFERFTDDKSGEDLLYGLGLGVSFLPDWRLSLQYERVEFDVDSTSLGLSYRF